jgi:hypothetical protein
MEKTPTAEEIMQNHLDPHDCLRPSKCYDMTLDAMVEFAKLHVQSALKVASQKAVTKEDIAIFAEGTFVTQIVDKDSILNSYPLENIK